MYFFSYLEPVCCSMSSPNCCFLTCKRVSQEAGQVVWYSCLFKNFPQFVVIYRVKGFGIVNKAEIDIFLELSCFFDNPTDVGNLISGSSAQLSFCNNNLLHYKTCRSIGYLTTKAFQCTLSILRSVPLLFLFFCYSCVSVFVSLCGETEGWNGHQSQTIQIQRLAWPELFFHTHTHTILESEWQDDSSIRKIKWHSKKQQ